MGAFSDEQRAFLTAHKQAALATGRKDGSPQISTVAYAVLGDGPIVSAGRCAPTRC